MGEKLYKQFRSFVKKNKSLYDDDFIEKLLNDNFSITDVDYTIRKRAIRLIVESNGYRPMIVMIPWIFISDPIAYKNSRIRKRNFGKDATDEHINKHYNGEIDKLNKEIAKLKTERASMSLFDGFS